MSFKDKWFEVVQRKNSVLCAGLDPAIFEMGRGEKGLPEGVDLLEWSRNYVEAVAPYCAAIKPNLKYFEDSKSMAVLEQICEFAKEKGLIVIEDAKIADIGSTNDAGMYKAAKRADAVTLSPFPGNIANSSELARDRDIGLIVMCLMSNPEYEIEKRSLKPIGVDDTGQYKIWHKVDGGFYAVQYEFLAHHAQRLGIDGIVIGAPSKNNHIQDHELQYIRDQVDDDMLVLLPGLGFQGGDADKIWDYFGPKNVIVNVGRSLMFPEGSHSTPQMQASAAKNYQDKLNELRSK